MFIPGVQPRLKRDTINEDLLNIRGFISDEEATKLTARYFKENIRVAVELLTGYKLYPFQEMMIRIMLERDYVMLILSRGMSKTFTAAMFCVLYAIFEPNSKIAVLSKTFRQSRMILQNIEDFSGKPTAGLFRECKKRASSYKNDEWKIFIGSSTISALPLGDGQKLRGFRFNMIVIDEFLLMPEKIVNEVITPFLSTNADPKKREELEKIEEELIKKGLIKPEEKTVFKKNKLVSLSSASYKFEFLYKKYCSYIEAITQGYEIDPETKKQVPTQASYAVVQLSYDAAPKSLYDSALLSSAKKEMSAAQFKREFGSQFTDDSGGFFSAKSILASSSPNGDRNTLVTVGEKNKQYVLSVDPSFAENDTSDLFAMTIFEIEEGGRYKPVHFYAVAGRKLKEHISYYIFLRQAFNIVFIILDNAGGVTFINAANESEMVKKAGLEVELISNNEVKLNDKSTDEWEDNIKMAAEQYSFPKKRIAFAQFFSSEWIRKVNERVQSDIDSKMISFPAPIEHNPEMFEKCRAALMPMNLTGIRITDEDDESNKVCNYEGFAEGDDDNDEDSSVKIVRNNIAERGKEARIIDIIERQDELLELTKKQLASIEAKQTANGVWTFDLPREIKFQKGANRMRKDLYSCLLLGSWGVRIYNEIGRVAIPEEEEQDWEPYGF